MTDVKITHIEEEPSAVDPLQISITPGNDPQIGQRVLGFKDGAGNARKCLNKSAHAPVKSLNVSDFTAAGILRTDATGDIFGDVNSLGDLNTALGGTTIDESTDPRDPNAHAIGGAAHSASTLAELNTKVSDATLDSSGDPRTPTQHAIGSATLHSSSTLAELNALVSDATLDTSSASRPPTAHAGSHESGGSDQLEHNKFYDLNTGDYRHVDPSPAAGGTSWETDDSDFAGLGDSVSVKSNETTLLQSYTASTGGSISTVTSDLSQVFTLSNDDYIRRYDRFTMELNEAYSGSAFWGGRAIRVSSSMLMLLDNSAITEINKNDLTDLTVITASGLTGSPTLGAVIKSNGDVYNCKAASTSIQIAVRGASTYTVTDYALPGITGQPYGITFDADETYFYVVDVSGTNNIVRKYDTATRTLQTSSVTITGTYQTGKIPGISGGQLVVYVGSYAYLLNLSDLAIKFGPGTTFVVGDSSCTCDGVTYTATGSGINMYQVPSLTSAVQGFRNRHGDGINSSPSVLNSDGVPVKIGDADIIRAGVHAQDATIHLTATQKTDLTDAGDSALHYHSADRDRANHTGTQTASTISDFDTEVAANTDVAANTAARHDAVTVADTAEIDMSITGQEISATLVASSIDETKLDASVNASLDLADTAVQPGSLAAVATSGSSADLSDAVRTITASDSIVVADRNGVIFSEPASADVYITLDAAVQAIPGFQFTVAVSESASYDTYVDAGGSSQNYLCGVSTGLLRGMFIFRVDKSGEAMPVQVPTITPPA